MIYISLTSDTRKTGICRSNVLIGSDGLLLVRFYVSVINVVLSMATLIVDGQSADRDNDTVTDLHLCLSATVRVRSSVKSCPHADVANPILSQYSYCSSCAVCAAVKNCNAHHGTIFEFVMMYWIFCAL